LAADPPNLRWMKPFGSTGMLSGPCESAGNVKARAGAMGENGRVRGRMICAKRLLLLGRRTLCCWRAKCPVSSGRIVPPAAYQRIRNFCGRIIPPAAESGSPGVRGLFGCQRGRRVTGYGVCSWWDHIRNPEWTVSLWNFVCIAMAAGFLLGPLGILNCAAGGNFERSAEY